MFKSAATRLAHNSTIPLAMGSANDVRPLQDWINVEKTVLLSLQRLASDLTKSAEAIRLWGTDEAQGVDLADTSTAACLLLTHYAHALSAYANHFNPVRESLKLLRTTLENLHSLKAQLRSVKSKADSVEKKLAKMSPEHKNFQKETDTLHRLNAEIAQLEGEVQHGESKLGEMKRVETRRILAALFGGLIECSEKGLVVGEMGKIVASEIPISQNGYPRPQYTAHQRNESLLSQAQQRLSDIRIDLSLPGAGSEPPHPSWSAPQSENTPENAGYYTSHGASPLTPIASEFSSHPHSGFMGQTSPPMSPKYPPSMDAQPSYTGLPPTSPPYGGAVDDFGVGLGPASNSQGAGRFATFPAKAPAPLPPPSGPPRLNSQDSQADFAQSVEAALSGFADRQYTPPPGPPPHSAGQHQFAPPPGPPPHLASNLDDQLNPPANPWDRNDVPPSPKYTSRPSSLDGPNDGLAYMGGESDQPGGHHVRFGQGADVDIADELRHGRRSQEAQRSFHPDTELSLASPKRTHLEPIQTPEQRERALDAAAARRVSLEMGSPPLPPKDPSPVATRFSLGHPTYRDDAPGSSPINRTFQHSPNAFPPSPPAHQTLPSLPPSSISPIPQSSPQPPSPVQPKFQTAPPRSSPATETSQPSSPAFEHQSSPHPVSQALQTSPYPNQSVLSSPYHNQALFDDPTPSPSLRSNTPLGRSSVTAVPPIDTTDDGGLPAYTSPTSALALGGQHSLPMSPTPQYEEHESAGLNPPSPPPLRAEKPKEDDQLDSLPPSSIPLPPTRLDSSASSSTVFRTPFSTPSTPSSLATVLPSTRTISAAAFKRQPRTASLGSTSEIDGTPPLSLNKKKVGPSSLQQPVEDDNFDYIGAYTYTEQDETDEPKGYGSGRFATNLEKERDDLR